MEAVKADLGVMKMMPICDLLNAPGNPVIQIRFFKVRKIVVHVRQSTFKHGLSDMD